MRLQVAFNLDPKGEEDDKVWEVNILPGEKIYDPITRECMIPKLIRKYLENKGLNLDYYFKIVAVYAI